MPWYNFLQSKKAESVRRVEVEPEERKMASVHVDPALRVPFGDQQKMTSYEQQASEGYELNATVYRCLNLVSKASGAIDWMAFTGNDEDREPQPDAPVLNLLARPNERMGKTRFFQDWISYLLLGGRSFTWANLVREGQRVHELWPLQPNRVEVLESNLFFDGIGGYKYTTEAGRMIEIPREAMLDIAIFSPLSMVNGTAPLSSAGSQVDQDNEASRWNRNLLRNRAAPPMYLQTKDGFEMDKEGARDLRDELREVYGGANNAGRPMFFRVPMDLTVFGLSPADMEWLKGRREAKLDIAQAFDVAPELIGLQEHKTYSNYKEARQALYKDTILPLMDFLRDELNRWLMPFFSDDADPGRRGTTFVQTDEWLDYLTENIPALQEDLDSASEREDRLVARGIKSRNESRAALGMEKSKQKGADDLTVSADTIPLDQVASNMAFEEE